MSRDVASEFNDSHFFVFIFSSDNRWNCFQIRINFKSLYRILKYDELERHVKSLGILSGKDALKTLVSVTRRGANGAGRAGSPLRFDRSAVAAVWPCWSRALLLIVTWKNKTQSGAERPSAGPRIRPRVLLAVEGAQQQKLALRRLWFSSSCPPIDGTDPAFC